MIKIPDLKLRVYRTILKDIAEYTELYDKEFKEDGCPTNDEYFVDFKRNLADCAISADYYKKTMVSKLCSFKPGDQVSVFDLQNKPICITVFRNYYISLKDGYIYFNTDASMQKKYNPKSCIIKLSNR